MRVLLAVCLCLMSCAHTGRPDLGAVAALEVSMCTANLESELPSEREAGVKRALDLGADAYSLLPLLRQVASGDLPKLRGLAVLALSKVAPMESLDAIIAALGDEDDEVRWVAARCLGRIGAKPAVPALKRALNDSCDDVAFAASDALELIGGAR